MPKSAEQTTSWVAEKISSMDKVLEAEIIGANILRIARKSHDPFVAAIIAVPVVTAEIVQPLLDADPTIEIVVNIPKESLWTGSAIESAVARRVAFGGLRDLMSAVSRDEDVREYTRSEYAFVERGLKQHTSVSMLEREFDRVYLVHRYELPSLRFVMLNEYELTGDHVRTARTRYGSFDAVLINNPNGKPTSTALEVAKEMGVGIFKWGAFLGRLNLK
jgi:hypothetical protein